MAPGEYPFLQISVSSCGFAEIRKSRSDLQGEGRPLALCCIQLNMITRGKEMFEGGIGRAGRGKSAGSAGMDPVLRKRR